jgi:hypothetical protein
MTRKLTEPELQERGMALLLRGLGYPNAVRFILASSRTGRDYTKERRELLKNVTLDELLAASDRIVARERSKARRKSA